MHICTVATTPPFDAHAMKVAAAVLTPSETVSLFATSKAVSMETV